MSGNTAGIDFTEQNDSRLSLALKGAFDFVFALLAITLFLPLLIVIAVAIRLTSAGPVFFCQKRTGYRGTEFTMYKFRTMRVNSQADTVAHFAHLGGMLFGLLILIYWRRKHIIGGPYF